MSENKKNDNNIAEKDLDKAAGGFYPIYSEEKYNSAGIEVLHYQYSYQDEYKIRASGELLTLKQADLAVSYFEENGSPVPNFKELEIYDHNKNIDTWAERARKGLC